MHNNNNNYDEELAIEANLIPDFRPSCIKHWIKYKNYYISLYFTICLLIIICLIIWSLFLKTNQSDIDETYQISI